MNLQKDNIRKLYLKFIIPSLGSAMVMSIFTMTDAIVIGKGVGGSVHMNIHRSLGETKQANGYFTTALAGLLIVTLLMWCLYLFRMPSILQLMGATDELYPYAMDYMQYFTWFLSFVTFCPFLSIFIRADQDPNRAMFVVILGGIFNIVLDIVFVMYCGFGMSGAAIASVTGICIQFIICSSHWLQRRINYICPIQSIGERIYIKLLQVVSLVSLMSLPMVSSYLSLIYNSFVIVTLHPYRCIVSSPIA